MLTCFEEVVLVWSTTSIQPPLIVSSVRPIRGLYVRIDGEILASKAPRMNRKIAIPVKEVNADMIQRLAPHPKNCRSGSYSRLAAMTYTETDPPVHRELDQSIYRH